ncbi:protein of unknown function [Petrocella atlantisensis]|uniref:Uncharacterized protein n=1 Tax=Petrocella atlantisensis TaxID=2173034 RepID=A0A3P7RXD2_9FIRM|nr:hypothetical protein [Petrocella atlantisensis]VDN47312.1 protein of unknown function [Petrocella atlantisensis]
MTKKKLDEIVKQIRQLGYDCRPASEEGQYCHVFKGEEQLCILFDNGGINTNAHSDIFNTARRTKEYLGNFENASKLKAFGLKAGYRKLLEFNDYVLAMREMESINEYEFVTWQYSPNKQVVNYGHYFSDYEAAKEDFSERAGLTDRYKKFTESQLKVIHSSLVSFVGLSEIIDYQAEKAIGTVLEKIGDIIPEIKQHEILEDEGMAPEDGLEM